MAGRLDWNKPKRSGRAPVPKKRGVAATYEWLMRQEGRDTPKSKPKRPKKKT